MENAEERGYAWNDTPARLRAALKNDEVTLFVQPILALRGAGGFPMGEVLIRLREEEKALIPPGEFLPVFEQHQMMPLLDRWVMLRTIGRLTRGSRVPRLAMNVHYQTLLDDKFPAFFADQIKTARIPPASLLFEIDESDMVGRPQAVQRFAAAMRAAGGGIVVDGFGRRMDSFEALEALRPDIVKIDGSLTLKIMKSETTEGMVKAILRLATSLRMGVVGECVEEQDVLLRLQALGVGYAQGFGVALPRPLDHLSPQFKAVDAA